MEKDQKKVSDKKEDAAEGSEKKESLDGMSRDELVKFWMDWLDEDPEMEAAACGITEEQIQEMSKYLLSEETVPEDHDLGNPQHVVEHPTRNEEVPKKTSDSGQVLEIDNKRAREEEAGCQDDVWSLQHMVEFHAKKAKSG